MRDHENAGTAGGEHDRAPARTPVERARTGPRGLFSLQSSLGNAAVVQLLREGGRGTGEEHAVQRSAVHDVLRGGGRPLDERTRTDMEARLGADFSDVRIHTDAAARASAAGIGARAYTSGNHVVIGEGGGDGHTLAHELTHVIQQRQGPVAGTETGGGLKVSDPSDRFEREAEANARRVMRAPASGLGGQRPPEGLSGEQAGPSGPAPVQRTLALGGKKDQAPDAGTAYDTIRRGLTNDRLISAWEKDENRPVIAQVLREWTEAPAPSAPKATGEERPAGSQDALARYYGTMDEAAAAVLDRANALPVADVEREIAQAVAADQKILKTLAGYVEQHLSPWLDQQKSQAQALQAELAKTTSELASTGRLYLPYVEYGQKTLASILAQPEAQKFATLISAIHDVAEILYTLEGLQEHVEVSEEEFKGYVFKDDQGLGGERNSPAWALHGPAGASGQSTDQLERTPVPKTFRGAMATPNQNNEQVRAAGRLGYPVSLGPSRTTGKLMKLADRTGADPRVKETIAYSLLALWYTEYRRDLTDIHRYHFVMDMAANFGVAYDPHRPPRNPATGADYSAEISKALQRFRTNQEAEAAKYWKDEADRKFGQSSQAGPASSAGLNALPPAAGPVDAAPADAGPAWAGHQDARAIMSALKAAASDKFRILGTKEQVITQLGLPEQRFDAALAFLQNKPFVAKPLVNLDRMGLGLTSPGKTVAKKMADL
ncbi:eCIS core domain-containing protein [Streptomyces griseus]